MPTFTCTVCNANFEIAQQSLDRYPNWQPKYCREHSPARKKKSPPKYKANKKAGGRSNAFRANSREENLTTAQVLGKYSDGPQDGVFTDGSCSPNPGPGGWGTVWVEGGEIVEQRFGKDGDTTNNRMELQALIAAFELLPEDAGVTVYTDSKLCVNTINTWAKGWEKNGWKRKSGPIKNLELVKRLYALKQSHPAVKLEWIAAHSGFRWNEYADALATAWMRGDQP